MGVMKTVKGIRAEKAEKINGGACAPYRRLHLCDKNLETISNYDSNNARHKLLAEVCMAANYEGDSIKTHYPPHQQIYGDSPSQLCTMLARSFADIGDIIRGRDLFYGNTQEKEKRKQLEKNLKKIFGKIHDNLKDKEAKKHYKKDKDPDFFKLREDWWTANRETVWKALTCKADTGNAYFRATCSDTKGPSVAQKQCRCDGANIVPTYFDYVPQFLRWFEEWAEDFCRKKKKKLENLQKQCRGQFDKKPRYCSRNGYDCEKTKPAIGRLRMGKGCTDCFFACNPYVEWIDKKKEEFEKQKEEFDKQKKKYGKEISGNGRKRGHTRGTTNSNYEGYESKFYKELQRNGYQTVNAFLGLLNKEEVCTKITDTEGGRIDFAEEHDNNNNDETKGTFYRSKYCKPCPLCGVERNGSGWEEKDKIEKCKSINLYKPINPDEGTKIEILKSGENRDDIKKKIEDFCTKTNGDTTNNGGNASSGVGGSGSKSDSKELYEEWTCYHVKQLEKENKENGVNDDDYDQDVQTGGGLCILQKKKHEGVQKQKTFHNFFYYWVAHMLKDSIYWRTEKLDKCLQNDKKKCGKKICNGDCDCFKRWIDKKEKDEWDKIKEQFSKQDINGTGGNDNSASLIAFSNDGVLQDVLELEFANENSKEDAENNVSAEEAKEIRHLRDIIKKKNQGTTGGSGTGGSTDGKKKTLMDELLDHEKGEAEKCIKKCQETQPKPPGGGGGAKSGEPRSEKGDDVEEEDDGGEEEEEDEGEEEEEEEEKEEEEVKTEDDNVEKVCATVDKILKDDKSLQEACTQKYSIPNRYWGWRCVTSGAETATGGEPTGSGSICIPPRRRRLYVGKLETLDTDSTSQSDGKPATQPQGQTASQDPSDKLRNAFIESAAIETFFLWDRYKKIKDIERQEKEKRERENGFSLPVLSSSVDGDSNDPQTSLQKGHIPPDFLRQMFYTLGDYRDILVRGGDVNSGSGSEKEGDSSNNDNIVVLASGSDKKSRDEMKKIQKAIDEHINSLKQAASVLKPQPPIQSREKLWQKNAQHIWHGMICALTYTQTSSSGGDKTTTITQDNDLKKALLDGEGKKPKTKTDGTNGKDYTYGGVRLEDENSGTQALSPTSPQANGSISLADFTSRPAYFRWLEEWGETFCRKRTEMLEKIKEECRNSEQEGKRHCSGDGHDCTEKELKHKNMSADPDCRDCYKQCRKYRKWIDMKFEEYEKQKCKYQGEHGKINGNSSGEGENCCEQIKQKTSAAEFLTALKHCKNNEGDEEKGNEEKENNKIDFDKPEKTFSRSTYCETCPSYVVKCNGGRGRRGKDPCTPHNEKGKSWESVFNANGGNSTEITVEMIDRRGPFIKNYSKILEESGNSSDSLFKTSRLFKSVRDQQWECRYKDEKTDICKLKNFNDKIDLNQYTTFKVLLIYWLEDFLYGYYLLKKRKIIEKCTKNGENKCSEEFKKHCACVKEWIEKKRGEWDKIKKHYVGENKSEDPDDYNVRSFLETWITQIPVANTEDKVIKLSKFDNFCGCSADASAQKKNDNEKDAIDCMINRLTEKITSCLSSTSDETPANCDENTPLVEDEDDALHEETEVKRPEICKDVVPTEEQEEKGGCEPPATQPEPPGISEKNPEQTPVIKPEEEAAAPEVGRDKDIEDKVEVKKEKKPKVSPKPQNPFEIPLSDELLTSMASSTLAWSVGIGFAAFSYFFLKKKTKSSVGNLFQILQIPKGDHDIPTLKSSNRYIPYVSDTYKGKTYIYMEGDSDEDKYAFMSDTTDVTSSESEYEEMDINDIYAPRAPKYKTLIEVVLEPSGNNTTASGKNTPSDTQNDIQNDGIPSSKITDNEWNTLKDEFISQYLQSEQPNGLPNDYTSGNSSTNTNITTTSRANMEEKPFITSIHDRDLYSGEEYNYNVNMVNSMNDIPINRDNNVYSGIDLINDSLNSGNQPIDIYDELLKRKENELFGTNHVKQTSIHSVSKLTNSDPLLNQLELFHKWLDRHRDMCEKLKNHHERLAKLKEKWENETHSGNTHPSDSNKTLNTDVSIQIHMDNPKPINQFTNMDTILDDLDKPFNEPYYYDMYDDDIYYDVHDHDASTVDSNNMDVPSKVQIEMDINTKLVKEKYPIADVWDI
ncbi:hypothetical protein PFNF135_06168 [Plasmodium falciparum NF135/5.C10]|uniref:Erythrocyte membrane protein 1 n=1 Tax=Plasmodium falciparum NF135/5.C10 TaxID=1036726 RepID=W4I7Q3_PLAFA|nr:hypothetical protein PFNF135_06168 [Plasmodium falciparum NF135/5.C10]